MINADPRRTLGRRRTVLHRNLPGGPLATELISALLANNRSRALGVLLQASNDGWAIRDVEDVIIAPAVSRLGELWLRGRIDDPAFERIGSMAEAVERAYRQSVLQPSPPTGAVARYV